MWPCIPSLLFTILFAVQGTHGFPFTHTDPIECGDLTVTWEGGSPPFRLLIIPDGQTLRNLSIPDNSFDGTTGSFTTPMPWTAGARFLLAMSDATDLTAGGITNILTLGSASGTSCAPPTIQADFFFSLPGTLEQCGEFPFTDYGGANRPVSLFGFVPSGRHFFIDGIQEETFTWRANEPAGTSIFFYMTDANQRNGGVAMREVESSNDSGCLPAERPTSSSVPPPSSRPSGSSSTSRKPSPSGGADDGSSTGDEPKEEKKGSNIGLIVGAAAGGFVALGLFAFIAVFCFRRKKTQKNQTAEIKIDIDAPPGPFKSPSNTYLLPSSYNGSNSNLAPNQAAAPYAQQSYQSGTSYGAPMGGASLQTRPSHQAATPTTSTHPSEYNPYAANEMGAMGHHNHTPQHSISNASAVSPYGGMSSGQSTTTTSYPPSGYGMAATGAGAYSAYNHYQQQQQYQAPNHQYYPPSSTQQYNIGPTGPMYATNADPPSTPFTPTGPAATAAVSGPTHKPSGSTEKRGAPVQAPQRVIQHQDIEESEVPEELPPQYSERRAPIPGLPSSFAGGSHNTDRKS